MWIGFVAAHHGRLSSKVQVDETIFFTIKQQGLWPIHTFCDDHLVASATNDRNVCMGNAMSTVRVAA